MFLNENNFAFSRFSLHTVCLRIHYDSDSVTFWLQRFLSEGGSKYLSNIPSNIVDKTSYHVSYSWQLCEFIKTQIVPKHFRQISQGLVEIKTFRIFSQEEFFALIQYISLRILIPIPHFSIHNIRKIFSSTVVDDCIICVPAKKINQYTIDKELTNSIQNYN